jgi:hypothetical protein
VCLDKNEDNAELQKFVIKILDPVIEKACRDEDHSKNMNAIGEIGEIILRLNADHIEEKYVDYVKHWLEVDYSSVINGSLQKIYKYKNRGGS